MTQGPADGDLRGHFSPARQLMETSLKPSKHKNPLAWQALRRHKHVLMKLLKLKTPLAGQCCFFCMSWPRPQAVHGSCTYPFWPRQPFAGPDTYLPAPSWAGRSALGSPGEPLQRQQDWGLGSEQVGKGQTGQAPRPGQLNVAIFPRTLRHKHLLCWIRLLQAFQ